MDKEVSCTTLIFFFGLFVSIIMVVLLYSVPDPSNPGSGTAEDEEIQKRMIEMTRKRLQR
tara:strand:+ start:319 stop:498 length:180 start_codon:yes stop_codon:yes gene_type:complete